MPLKFLRGWSPKNTGMFPEPLSTEQVGLGEMIATVVREGLSSAAVMGVVTAVANWAESWRVPLTGPFDNFISSIS
ncbi:hypothetical protein D3C84_970250 [compost metagenome]